MRRFALLMLLLGYLALPVAADPRPDILYTTRREFVRVSPPRPLTLNVHIDKFAYDPLGLEVAVAGGETQEGASVNFVRTLDARTGHELHRLTAANPPGSNLSDFLMIGWTPSGKYLLIRRYLPDPETPDSSAVDLVRWDLSADPPVVRPVDPLPYVPAGTRGPPGVGSSFASPNRRWVLFKQDYKVPQTEQTPESQAAAYILYDTEKNIFRPLKLPSHTSVGGWVDNTYLRLWNSDADPETLDVNTGQISPKTSGTGDKTPTSKQYPDLTLDVESRSQPNSKGGGQFPSQIVWIRCEPRQPQPLSAVGAGITMGKEDPQAVWSPTGKQVAFLNHGDLYVTDIAPVPALELLGSEKTALGLPLSCPEERDLAQNNLKKIGLGLVLYTQDHDEHYPPAAGVDEAIYPYIKDQPGIKDRTVFSVGKVHWVYHAPQNLSFAAMESPAETVLGTTNLPCGQAVLYADGHVKLMPKKEAP